MMRFVLGALVLSLCVPIAGAQQKQNPRETKVRADKEKVTGEGFWIYNDLPAAFAKAEETGRPLLVVLRCIPCEECVKLDDDLMDQDPVVRPLLEKFVCVRVVSTNGLDLSLFQFDTDQSFAAFMLNADKTIYGRFGTRSHRTEWIGDVSLPGLAAALQGALELHAGYPANRESLAGKRGPAPLAERPEMFASLKDKYTASLNYEGDVVRSCIHCHQIGDAIRDQYRTGGKPIPDEVLFPYPHPKSVGVTLNPGTRATITAVAADSVAAAAGLQAGDEIRQLNGQPILSMADVQWVLNAVPSTGGSVAAVVSRAGRETTIPIALNDGWRRAGDISWRVSSWGLRRMATGGLQLQPLDDARRKELKLAASGTAMRVSHVGKFGAHAAGMKAGFAVDDVIVAIDGRTDILTETDLMRYGVTEKKAGQTIKVSVLRGGEKKELRLPMQE